MTPDSRREWIAWIVCVSLVASCAGNGENATKQTQSEQRAAKGGASTPPEVADHCTSSGDEPEWPELSESGDPIPALFFPNEEWGSGFTVRPREFIIEDWTPPPEPERPRWWREMHPRVTYSGRIVRPNGSPIANARVRLVGQSTMPWSGRSRPPARLFGTVRSDRSGRFELDFSPDRIRQHFLYLTVEYARGARTVVEPKPNESNDIVLVPSRPVRIRAVCRHFLEERAHYYPSVSVYRGASQELWSRRYLAPEGSDWPPPGLPEMETTPLEGTLRAPRTLEVVARLPIGDSTLVFDGACGFTTQSVSVPWSGRTPRVRAELPASNAGDLAFYLEAPSVSPVPVSPVPVSPGNDRELFSIQIWDGQHFYRRVTLSPCSTTWVHELPPGRYFYGRTEDPDCQHQLEVSPGATARRALAVNSCSVTRELPVPDLDFL